MFILSTYYDHNMVFAKLKTHQSAMIHSGEAVIAFKVENRLQIAILRNSRQETFFMT